MSVIFVVPRANTALRAPLRSVLAGLKPTYRRQVQVVYLEDLTEALVRTSDRDVATYYGAFREKFVI